MYITCQIPQDNDEIVHLLMGNVLETSNFHKKHHNKTKGIEGDFSITWQQAKEIIFKNVLCVFLYHQTLEVLKEMFSGRWIIFILQNLKKNDIYTIPLMCTQSFNGQLI